MSDPDHFCPGCGKAVAHFARYPWYFCQDCVALATDGKGARLEFANAGFSGGFVWRRAGEDAWADAGSVACLIKSRPVIVGEARFGGIVAEPLRSGPIDRAPYNLMDLRG